ncbi:unnamed protein product [Prorocentrum cordatum]|uniref:Uncharacterized protein n=1 Tax=Prorocentrum cordatum TaxID=2364126 RepID=A0ABN9PIX1_9DINO|nr:unnamed protein product [Polarella glacialis]
MVSALSRHARRTEGRFRQPFSPERPHPLQGGRWHSECHPDEEEDEGDEEEKKEEEKEEEEEEEEEEEGGGASKNRHGVRGPGIPLSTAPRRALGHQSTPAARWGARRKYRKEALQNIRGKHE